MAPALLALSIAIGLLRGGAAEAAPSPCPGADMPVSRLELDQFDASVFCLINQRRAENGRRVLVPNRLLHRAAGDYAFSLLEGHFFSHHGDFRGASTGSTVIGRLREVGYIRRRGSWSVGEDLHWTTAGTSRPADVVEAWVESPIHRKYLFNAKYEELGVGAQRGVPFDASQFDGITVAAEFGVRQAR